MDGHGSRRDFLKASALSITALSGYTAKGLQAQADSSSIDRIQKMLASPVEGESLEIMKRTIRGNEAAAAGRMRFRLPENSEPCTAFHPTKPRKR